MENTCTYGVNLYQNYFGPYSEIMPQLISDGRIPLNTAQIMQKRLETRKSPNEANFWSAFFWTTDAIVRNFQGHIKIVLDSAHLLGINPNSKFYGDALELTDEEYRKLDGEEFKDGIPELNRVRSGDNLRKNPILRLLARDQQLLDDYVEISHGAIVENHLNAYPIECELRAFGIEDLRRRNYFHVCPVNYSPGILCGALSDINLGKIGNGTARPYSSEDLLDAKKQLEELSRFLNPEALNRVRSLVERL